MRGVKSRFLFLLQLSHYHQWKFFCCSSLKFWVYLYFSFFFQTLHLIYWVILLALSSECIQNKDSSHFIHCYPCAPSYQHISPELLKQSSSDHLPTVAFIILYSLFFSVARVVSIQVRLCHPSTPKFSLASQLMNSKRKTLTSLIILIFYILFP